MRTLITECDRCNCKMETDVDRPYHGKSTLIMDPRIGNECLWNHLDLCPTCFLLVIEFIKKEPDMKNYKEILYAQQNPIVKTGSFVQK